LTELNARNTFVAPEMNGGICMWATGGPVLWSLVSVEHVHYRYALSMGNSH